jgi:hypothetical protein
MVCPLLAGGTEGAGSCASVLVEDRSEPVPRSRNSQDSTNINNSDDGSAGSWQLTNHSLCSCERCVVVELYVLVPTYW